MEALGSAIPRSKGAKPRLPVEIEYEKRGSSLICVGGFEGSPILQLGPYNFMTAGNGEDHDMYRYLLTQERDSWQVFA